MLLADDHETVLERVSEILSDEFEVVGAVSDGAALRSAVADLEPDVAVVDIAMPTHSGIEEPISGIEAVRQLRDSGRPTKVVFLTVYDDPDLADKAREVGGLGYVIKSRLALDLSVAVSEALAGRSFVSPSTRLKST